MDIFVWIIGDGYKNGGEVNSIWWYLGMDVDLLGRDNYFGFGRGVLVIWLKEEERWWLFLRIKKIELREVLWVIEMMGFFFDY